MSRCFRRSHQKAVPHALFGSLLFITLVLFGPSIENDGNFICFLNLSKFTQDLFKILLKNKRLVMTRTEIRRLLTKLDELV